MDELIASLQRAAAALKQGHHDEAEALARDAIARDPARADAHATLGAILTQRRRPADAE